MNESFSSPVAELLDSQHIAYEVIEIPLSSDRKPIRSLEELLETRGGNPHRIVKSLVFRTGSDAFILLAAAGSGRADWGVLRKFLNEKRLAMAQPEEVLSATGFPIGAVPPIAVPDNIRILVDQSVLELDQVVIGSGVLGYALELSGEAFKKLLDLTNVGMFIKAE